jgi:hypothetical protein
VIEKKLLVWNEIANKMADKKYEEILEVIWL